jgi:hypothetical protein
MTLLPGSIAGHRGRLVFNVSAWCAAVTNYPEALSQDKIKGPHDRCNEMDAEQDLF